MAATAPATVSSFRPMSARASLWSAPSRWSSSAIRSPEPFRAASVPLGSVRPVEGLVQLDDPTRAPADLHHTSGAVADEQQAVLPAQLQGLHDRAVGEGDSGA